MIKRILWRFGLENDKEPNFCERPLSELPKSELIQMVIDLHEDHQNAVRMYENLLRAYRDEPQEKNKADTLEVWLGE